MGTIYKLRIELFLDQYESKPNEYWYDRVLERIALEMPIQDLERGVRYLESKTIHIYFRYPYFNEFQEMSEQNKRSEILNILYAMDNKMLKRYITFDVLDTRSLEFASRFAMADNDEKDRLLAMAKTGRVYINSIIDFYKR